MLSEYNGTCDVQTVVVLLETVSPGHSEFWLVLSIAKINKGSFKQVTPTLRSSCSFSNTEEEIGQELY